MSGKICRLLAVFIAGLFLSACAEGLKENVIVVLPNADGSVGAITVNDGSSSVVLDQPLAAVQINARGEAEPVAVADQQVAEIFGSALSAQPIPPSKFTLYFLEGTDELTDESKVQFENVFADVDQRESSEIWVVGHTDTVGSEAANHRLSLMRAVAIRDKLVFRDVYQATISVAGRGEIDLAVATEDDTDEPLNRRVEITVR